MSDNDGPGEPSTEAPLNYVSEDALGGLYSQALQQKVNPPPEETDNDPGAPVIYPPQKELARITLSKIAFAMTSHDGRKDPVGDPACLGEMFDRFDFQVREHSYF